MFTLIIFFVLYITSLLYFGTTSVDAVSFIIICELGYIGLMLEKILEETERKNKK